MTDEEREDDAAEVSIEDLEAPAAAQGDVAGGANRCASPTCVGLTKVKVFCTRPTCTDTSQDCTDLTGTLVVHEA